MLSIQSYSTVFVLTWISYSNYSSAYSLSLFFYYKLMDAFSSDYWSLSGYILIFGSLGRSKLLFILIIRETDAADFIYYFDYFFIIPSSKLAFDFNYFPLVCFWILGYYMGYLFSYIIFYDFVLMILY